MNYIQYYKMKLHQKSRLTSSINQFLKHMYFCRNNWTIRENIKLQKKLCQTHSFLIIYIVKQWNYIKNIKNIAQVQQFPKNKYFYRNYITIRTNTKITPNLPKKKITQTIIIHPYSLINLKKSNSTITFDSKPKMYNQSIMKLKLELSFNLIAFYVTLLNIE